MDKKNKLKIDHDGNILEYNLPFEIDPSIFIGEILPIYSYPDSFVHLLDLEIDAYEFSYKSNDYVVDTVLQSEGDGYIIYIEDRTDFYKKKSIQQSIANAKKIELEYSKLNLDFLTSKNKYLEFVVGALSDLLDSALSRMDESVQSLNEVNTYVKNDDQIIKTTIDSVKSEITYIKKTITHMSIFKQLDPISLLDQPEFVSLYKLIKEIAEELSISLDQLSIKVPDSLLLYGNKMFFKELLKYYFKNNMTTTNKIEFISEESDTKFTYLKVNYFTRIKGFIMPQKVTQDLLLPTSYEIETNPELVERVFENIKSVLLRQANLLNDIAA